MKRRALAVVAISAAMVAACGDDGTGPELPESEFVLSVDGALVETVRGPAHFGTDTDENGEPIFAVLLGEQTSRHLVVMGREGSSRPGPGTYPIRAPGEGGWELLHMVTEGEEILGLFMASTGQVVITESSETVLRGTIEFEASGFMGEQEGAIEVSGSFVAVPASQLMAAPAGGAARVR